jgi:serine/threonine protein kinase
MSLSTADRIEKVTIEPRLNPRTWDGATIRVEWTLDHARSYVLKAPRLQRSEEAPTLRVKHSTLTNTYLAETEEPQAAVRQFIVKLPDVQGLSDSDLRSRYEHVRDAFRVEVDLRARLDREVVPLLPELLLPASREEPPCLHGEGISSNIPFLPYEYIDGLSLREWANAHHCTPGRAFDGLAELHHWFDIAVALLQSLDVLHRQRITHGFVCPDTIIVPADISGRFHSTNQVKFINAAGSQKIACFLQARINENRLPTGTEFRFVRRWYDAVENRYFRENQSGLSSYWSYKIAEGASDYHCATDIFSMGVTLAYLATGREDIVCPFDYVEPWDAGEVGWQIVAYEHRRKHYHVMKAELLDELAKAVRRRTRSNAKRSLTAAEYGNCLRQAEVILLCTRSRIDRRARNVGHAMTAVRLFGFLPDTQDKKSTQPKAKTSTKSAESEERIESIIDRRLSSGGLHAAVKTILHNQAVSMQERLDTLSGEAPSLRVTGGRSALVDALLCSLSTLNKGDMCVALTTASIWIDENLGPTSRSSTMLQLIRLREVGLRWVIIVREQDLASTRVQRVLAFRHADDDKIAAITSEHPSGQGFFYAPVGDETYEKFLRLKRSFIGFLSLEKYDDYLVGKIPDLDLLIAPDFASRSGPMAALNMWIKPKRQDLLTEFRKYANADSVGRIDRTT